MDLHDRKMGVEPIRPAKPSAAPARQQAVSAAPANSGRERIAAAVVERNKRPWTASQPNDRPAPAASPVPARIEGRAAPQVGGRKTIVTARWWDSKGPRTIDL